MRASVIISTYNSPQWLSHVLWGFSIQSHRDFELLIADDGSTRETADLLQEARAATGLAIRHIWHEDRGFRKCTILNKAIAAAESDYIIFTDGDCIPRWDFVAQHVRLSRPGWFLSGGAVRLPMALSKAITREDIVQKKATDWKWLLTNGLGPNKHQHMLSASPFWAAFMDAVTTTKATWNGGNASTWRKTLLEVNGYDERMEHGGLDRELGERLINAGIRSRQIRHRAVCVHLDHSRGYANKEALQRNQQIRRDTRRLKLTRTDYGITKSARQQAA